MDKTMRVLVILALAVFAILVQARFLDAGEDPLAPNTIASAVPRAEGLSSR